MSCADRGCSAQPAPSSAQDLWVGNSESLPNSFPGKLIFLGQSGSWESHCLLLDCAVRLYVSHRSCLSFISL